MLKVFSFSLVLFSFFSFSIFYLPATSVCFLCEVPGTTNNTDLFKAVLQNEYGEPVEKRRLEDTVDIYLYASDKVNPSLVAITFIFEGGMSVEELFCQMHGNDLNSSEGTNLVVVCNVLIMLDTIEIGYPCSFRSTDRRPADRFGIWFWKVCTCGTRRQ